MLVFISKFRIILCYRYLKDPVKIRTEFRQLSKLCTDRENVKKFMNFLSRCQL